MTTVYFALAAGAAALGFALVLTLNILRQDKGDQTVQFIGRAIQEGAMAFLAREYRMLAIFVLLVFAILAIFIDYDVLGRIDDEPDFPSTAIAYLAGAGGSALAGFIGMSIAVRANTRTTVKAMEGTQRRPARRLQQRDRHGRLRRGDRTDRHHGQSTGSSRISTSSPASGSGPPRSRCSPG